MFTMIQTICASSKEDKKKKNVDYCVNEKKLTKIWNDSCSPNVWQIFFIFNRVDIYDDTTNLCKFQKNWIKNVDSDM